MLCVGDRFPEFELTGVERGEIKEFKSSSLRGRWAVIFFYPEDFSFICPTEVTGFNDLLPEFTKASTDVIGVSVDSVASHREWAKELGVDYPLVSDEDAVLSRETGVLSESDGRSERVTFIIDPDSVVQSIMATSRNVGRSVKETLRVLLALVGGNLCPADYDPRTLKETSS